MPKKYKILIIFLIFFVFPVSGVFSEEKKDPFNVAILKEEGLKYAGLPDGLNAEWIGNVLKDEYNVIFLNIEQLKDRTLFNADNVDLLILPYGDMAPEEVSPEIVDFIRSGGGLFTAGGRPFSGKYLLQLGISYYIVNSIDIASLDTKGDILKLEFEMKQPFINQYGLCVKTSERIHNIVPTIGNVFPFRIPARDFMNPVIMLDKEGNYIGASITLVKSWSNPYKDTRKTPNKWCLIGSMGDNHPLNPKHESSKKRLKDILKFLSAKVILKYVDTEYASYRNGEAVNLNIEVLNYGDEKKDAILDISIEEGGRNLFKVIKNISMSPGETVKINTIWNPVALDGDFYEVSAVLRLGGQVIDEGRNAFTVWHRDKLINFPELAIKGRRFYQNGLPVYLHGINYYESKRGALMWARPNILDIEKDLRLMSKAGINFLRAHYHHPSWFKDYFEAVGLPVPAYFENTENIERSLRIMDAFIILCNRHGIYFQPDIFTLVPSGMGDPKGWIGDIERCRDKEKIEAQKKFIDILAARYKDIPNITWDLWNEPFLGKENIEILRLWVEKIRDCFKQNKDTHLITLGSDESIELAGGLDFLCGHSHDVEIPETDKPFIMQEVWNESDLSPEREIAQKEKLKKGFLECIKKGGAGFAPWQWTRQSCLWDDASDPEKWDNELGLCVREDGSLKPAGKMYKNLIKEAR